MMNLQTLRVIFSIELPNILAFHRNQIDIDCGKRQVFLKNFGFPSKHIFNKTEGFWHSRLRQY